MRGRVQGVNFRATAAAEASRLGVRGVVWNRDDGAVEVVADADVDALGEFEQWLRQGPQWASVASVEADDDRGTEPLTGFSIR